MRKMQTVRAEVRQLSINNGVGLTTTDIEAADVLCEHFQQTFTKEEEFQNSIPGVLLLLLPIRCRLVDRVRSHRDVGTGA